MDFERLFDKYEDDSNVQSASKNLRMELEHFGEIEKRRKVVECLFRQVALASRLKAEYSSCRTERSPPISCKIIVQHLTSGRNLIFANVRNECGEDFVGWNLLIRLSKLEDATCNIDCLKSGNIESANMSTTCMSRVSILKDGCSINVDAFVDEIYISPTLIRCFLSKSFQIDQKSPVKTFEICVHSEVLTVLDQIRLKCQPTFVSSVKMDLIDNDPQIFDENSEIRFTFCRSFLKCINNNKNGDYIDTKDMRDVCRLLLSWLCPAVVEINFEPSSCSGEKVCFNNFTLNSNVSVSIDFLSKTCNDSVQMLIRLKGDSVIDNLIRSVKAGILLKYLRFINDSLKFPKTIDLNLSSLKFALNQIQIQEENFDESFFSLTENIFSKLPFV